MATEAKYLTDFFYRKCALANIWSGEEQC